MYGYQLEQVVVCRKVTPSKEMIIVKASVPTLLVTYFPNFTFIYDYFPEIFLYKNFRSC